MAQVKERVAYPYAVIECAARNVPESVREFVMANAKDLGSPEKFEEYAECVFVDCLKGAAEERAVRYIIREYRSDSRKTHKRWAESYHENMKLPESSRAYPFQELLKKRKVLSDKEWELAFSGKDYAHVLGEQEARVEEWIADMDSLFTDYPARLTRQKKAKAAEMDTFLAMAKVIEEEYGCDIEHTMSAYIDEMTHLPTFSGKRVELKNGGNPVRTVEMSEDGSEVLQMAIRDDVSVGDVVRTLDQRDQAIILYAITRAESNGVDSQAFTVGLHELASKVMGVAKPSAQQMADVEKRCYGIAQLTYIWRKDGVQRGAVNYFSSAVRVDGTNMIRIVLGDVIQDAILEKRLRRIPNADLARLKTKEAHIMALPIQKLWIRAYCLWRNGKIPECSMDITYDMLLSMISFPSQNKRKNFNLAKEVFAEFRDCGLYIKSFQANNIGYCIHADFVPLTESEERDLSVWGYNKNGEDAIDVEFVES